MSSSPRWPDDDDDPEERAALAEITSGARFGGAGDLAEVLDLLDQGRDAEAYAKLGLGPKGGRKRAVPDGT